MEQNTETKTETKLKPEEMPEYQDKLSQSLIRGWRKQFPEWTDERIIEELEALYRISSGSRARPLLI